MEMALFNMIKTIFTVLFMILRMLFKPVVFVLRKTGLWLFIIFFAVIGFNQEFFRKLFIVPDILLVGSLLFAVYTTVQSVMRFLKQDPSYKILNFEKGEKKLIDPKVKDYFYSSPLGFLFGKKGFSYVCKPENVDGHILVVGGAGSGKSSCIAIPSLKSWQNRVFAIDIKGELAEKTGNERQSIKVFNPANESLNALGYNPFYILDTEPLDRVKNTREIVLAILPLPTDTKDPFWIESAQNLLTGLILYNHGKRQSFIQTMTNIQTVPIRQAVAEIHDGTDTEAKMFINQFLDLDDRTLGGIYSQLNNVIIPFATDRHLKNALNKRQNISPEMLENGNDIFIQIPEHMLEQWKNLLSLMVSQFLKHFEKRDENLANEPILFMLDEFARLGKIEPIINGLATLRSKKVTIALLLQSLAQLDVTYGKEQRQVIADNCPFKAVLSATDTETQEYFSKMVGTYDKTKHSSSVSNQELNVGNTTGKSKTTEEKRIVKPEDFGYLEDIVLFTPKGFMRIEKAPYYKDKAFNKAV